MIYRKLKLSLLLGLLLLGVLSVTNPVNSLAINQKISQDTSSYVDGTWSYDFESASQGLMSNSSMDFFWEQMTSTERYIQPINTATVHHYQGSSSYTELDLATAQAQSYSSTKLNASVGGAIGDNSIILFITGDGN